MNKNQEKITTTFKCTNSDCLAKFKKTCPADKIACSPIIKCPKCSWELKKI